MLICVSLNEFIGIAIGKIYELAPYHKPRFIDEITDEIIKRFKIDCSMIGHDFIYHEVELKDLYKFIKNILMPIDKFRELNLSPKEYRQGISVDDENRPKFQFVSAFFDVAEDDNFIDLDACIQNIFSVYEHQYFREWAYGDTDINRLHKFRQIYEERG